jgi:hypothetical protein
MGLTVISFGGGVQSTALLVLACQRKIKADAALFANVGDDSEHPATLEYVRKVARPYAVEHGIEVIELHRTRRNGETETLMERLQRVPRSIDIPVRMANGSPGNRKCTSDFKMQVVGRWLKAQGASAANPATVHIGISFDEAHRIGNKRMVPYEIPSYPLTELRLTRQDCIAIIKGAHWPVPGKSSCYFCPFTKPSQFATMRRTEPALFYKAVELERMLNERRVTLGKDPVYLTRFGRPLDEAVAEEQPGLDFGTGPGETCDEGYCWT